MPENRKPRKKAVAKAAAPATAAAVAPAVPASFPASAAPLVTAGTSHPLPEGVGKPPRSDALIVRGAREHNLRNISVTIPRDKLTVVTGLSGSGKSSLAFDTIYAEGSAVTWSRSPRTRGSSSG
jgi:excinuclease ABC subunit A